MIQERFSPTNTRKEGVCKKICNNKSYNLQIQVQKKINNNQQLKLYNGIVDPLNMLKQNYKAQMDHYHICTLHTPLLCYARPRKIGEWVSNDVTQ